MAKVSKYETSSGKTLFEVRYRTPDRRTTRRRGFTTARDANAFANSVETSKLKGEYIGASTGRTTVGELGPLWLERQRAHLKPRSLHTYAELWRVHIEPRWGPVRIAAIRHTDVAAWVAQMSTTHATSTVSGAYQILCRILDDAVRDRLLAANPARGVKMPPKAQPRQMFLTAAQLDEFADECGPYRSLILLLGVGGLRWGEAIALRVCDIDFLRRRVNVHRNAGLAGSVWHLGTPKSGKSREVPLPPGIVAALAATAQGKALEDLLWTAPRAGGYLRHPN